MSNINHYTHDKPFRRRTDARQLRQALASLETEGRLEAAKIEMVADVQARRAHAIGRVARAGLGTLLRAP